MVFFFVFAVVVSELSNLWQKQLLLHCSVAAASHLRWNNEEKTQHTHTHTSETWAASAFTAPASVFFFLTLLLYFSAVFSPQWEHFYGNWSPCNNSSRCARSTPDSRVTSRRPSTNQLSTASHVFLPSAMLDAAAARQRWRQKDGRERGVFFPTCGL